MNHWKVFQRPIDFPLERGNDGIADLRIGVVTGNGLHQQLSANPNL
jgi:hypothetical protein